MSCDVKAAKHADNELEAFVTYKHQLPQVVFAVRLEHAVVSCMLGHQHQASSSNT